MNKWKNTSFGNKGQFYPLLYMIPLPLIAAAIFLIIYSFSDGFRVWERFIIFGFGVFFFIYFIKGIEAIKITRAAVKEISVKDNIFRIHTFGGMNFDVRQLRVVEDSNDFFAKKNIQFLFPNNVKNIIIKCDRGEYYLAGNIPDIVTLIRLLDNEV